MRTGVHATITACLSCVAARDMPVYGPNDRAKDKSSYAEAGYGVCQPYECLFPGIGEKCPADRQQQACTYSCQDIE
jgi:hypothetical protein